MAINMGKLSVPRAVGVYVSIPFCRAKCTFCNFASEAFPAERMQGYVERLTEEIRTLPKIAAALGCELPQEADSVYLGGGTPSLLNSEQFAALWGELRRQFAMSPDAEITLEAAPGQIGDGLLESALQVGVNRFSLGVQSFVDRESRAVGRLHTGAACLEEIARLKAAGVSRVSLDLIAGLPHQAEASWAESLRQAVESGVEHVSVYMLETDGESRLGEEVERLRAMSQLSVLGQQARYHAEAVPSDEQCAELYQQACETLDAQGFAQYEISNFAKPGAQSRHNRKYWERDAYVGLGLDAHSMLLYEQDHAVRFQNADELDVYMGSTAPAESFRVSAEAAFEEAVFLGLRLNEGIALTHLQSLREPAMLAALMARARDLAGEGLMSITEDRIALTAKGRVLSSAVFGELLTATVA